MEYYLKSTTVKAVQFMGTRESYDEIAQLLGYNPQCKLDYSEITLANRNADGQRVKESEWVCVNEHGVACREYNYHFSKAYLKVPNETVHSEEQPSEGNPVQGD